MPLNKYRDQVVNDSYSKKGKAVDPFHKLKSIEGSSIPPSEAHIDRSAFVARLWGSAHKQQLKKTPDSGWDLENGSYRIIWFLGNQLPFNLTSDIETEYDDDKDEDHAPSLDEMESSDEEELEDE